MPTLTTETLEIAKTALREAIADGRPNKAGYPFDWYPDHDGIFRVIQPGTWEEGE